MTNTDCLEKHRKQIDRLDNQLCALIQDRLRIVEKIGILKHRHNLPIFSSRREKEILRRMTEKSNVYKINQSLVQSVFGKLMNESYVVESTAELQFTDFPIRTVTFLHHKKPTENFLRTTFEHSKYKNAFVHVDQIYSEQSMLRKTDLLIVDVPKTRLKKASSCFSFLPQHCVVLDLSKFKAKTIDFFTKMHTGPILSVHSDCFECRHIVNQNVFYCDGQHPDGYAWMLDHFRRIGAKIHRIEAKQYDECVRFVESLRSFVLSKFDFSANRKYSIANETFKVFFSHAVRSEFSKLGHFFDKQCNS